MILHDNFRRKSLKPYGPPTSVTWLQLQVSRKTMESPSHQNLVAHPAANPSYNRANPYITECYRVAILKYFLRYFHKCNQYYSSSLSLYFKEHRSYCQTQTVDYAAFYFIPRYVWSLICRVKHTVNTLHSRSASSLFRRLWAAGQRKGRQNLSNPPPSSFVASAHAKGGSEC
jgi:hypothetical protein